MSSSEDESADVRRRDLPATYPVGFAVRFLKWTRTAGEGWTNVDFESSELDFVDDYAESSARLVINDAEIEPVWARLVRDSRADYPELSGEERVFSELALTIEEFIRTNHNEKRRFFTIGEILR